MKETSKQSLCFHSRKQHAETRSTLGIVYGTGRTASYSALPLNGDKGSENLGLQETTEETTGRMSEQDGSDDNGQENGNLLPFDS